jgi:hypothetical protein
MRSRLKFPALLLLAAALCPCLAAVPGCQGSLQAQLDRAEVLYGEGVGETDDLYKRGEISYDTFHQVITPARRTARQAIDQAKLQAATGQVDVAKLTLETALDALRNIDQQRAKAKAVPAGAPPATRPATVAPASPASGEPLTATGTLAGAIALLELINRLSPIVAKLVKGDELTPEERALAERHSADATAEADALDAAGPRSE